MSHNSQPAQGSNQLSLVSYNNHLAVVKYLLANGASIEEKDSVGFTPLMIASYNNHLDVVTCLL